MGSGLQLTDLRVGYRSGRRWPGREPDHVVVSGINVTAEPGTLTCAIGPNGAGKSTLLRSVVGLQPILSGRALLDGRDLANLTLRERARRTAVVLTDRVDAGLLKGIEVVELGRHPHATISARLTAAERDLVRWALERLHATELAGQRFAELSDGQRQRILLARALVQEPRLLVLDEPSAFLDVGARVDLIQLLKLVAVERSMTVLISTHEVELALRMSDSVWLIHDGRLQQGSPDQLIADGAIGRVFNTNRTEFEAASCTFRLRTAE